MNKTSLFLVVVLMLNIIILVPVVSSLLLSGKNPSNALGPLTDARLVLTSIYAAIAIISVLLVFMHLKNIAWAVPMTVALFAVQITYKLITVPLVGLGNPVVIANVAVVVVQAVALAVLWNSMRA